MSALPTCIALRSKLDNKSYLRSVHDESHGGSMIELGHGDGGIMNPRARFYLEPSKEHEGLVHVRCCYNNKYWVPQQRVLPGRRSARWVIGTADEPEEDLSKSECSLHKLITIDGEQAEGDGSTTCRFLHSKLGKYACSTMSSTSSIRSYMHIEAHEDEADSKDGGGLIDAFTVIDVSNQKQLPSYLVFKGDNDHFLAGHWAPMGTNVLHFKGKDNGDKRVLHTISTNDDGVVRIQSNFFGKFWRRCLGSDNELFRKAHRHCILGESDDTAGSDIQTLFSVITWDDMIALRNLGNNKFCRRASVSIPPLNWFEGEDGKDVLKADGDSVTNEAKLQCIEPVLSRDIYDVDFRLSEARMYTSDIGGVTSQTAINRTSVPNTSTLNFTWTNTVETTWSSNVSMKINIATTFKTGVPFLAEGKIEISTEFSGSYTWGKTETKQEQVSKEIVVQVPPMKKVTVKAIGSNGHCDIPFSYKQRDVLSTGEEVIQEFTDGIYVGVKTSNITFETIEEDL